MPRPARALSFGSAAERYERYRPGYPDALVDTVLGYAGRPVLTAVEVGAGTGKATRAFASRGLEVTAVEPDDAMAAVLMRTTAGLAVQTVVSAFEDVTTDRPVDLVYAAASWHWTDAATRWCRAADLLVPGGVLALFGRPRALVDAELQLALDGVELGFLPADEPVGDTWSLDEAAATGRYQDPLQVELPGIVTATRDEHLGLLSTTSAYLLLEPARRTAALARVGEVLPGTFEVDAGVRLSLLRRT